MRIKQMIIVGMALTTLFGCGTKNSESMGNRQLDRVENVRHQSGQGELYRNDLEQSPDQRKNQADLGRYKQQNQIDRKRDGTRDNGMFEDGWIDQDNRGNDLDRNSNNSNRDQRNRINESGEYRVADQIAEHVATQVDEINRAFVLTMGNNAYVACQLENDRVSNQNNDLSDKLEEKVTKVVKDADDKIDRVYVSSNPDFVDLTSNYMRDVDRGKPIEGFFDQFSEMVERIFPTRNR